MIYLGIFSGSKTITGMDRIAAGLRKVADELDIYKYTVVYGGGTSGLMGVIPKHYAGRGGRVIGVDADMFVKRFGSADFGEIQVHSSFAERQRALIERSDVILVLPGGLGTMSEMFDVLTLNDLKLRNIPVIVYNPDGFYDDIIRFIEKRQKDGFIKEIKSITYADRAETVLSAILDKKQ